VADLAAALVAELYEPFWFFRGRRETHRAGQLRGVAQRSG
jgi:hypothetical protein